jgi:hypothetical protein
MPVTIVSDVVSGAILPYPPLRSVPLSTYGVPLADVELTIEDDSARTWSEPWGIALKQAGLETLENGSGYTFVLLGPNPWVQSTGFWNETLITLVRNAPTDP